MEPLLAIVSGALFAFSVYLLLRRDIVRMVIGLVVLSNTVNLALFTLGGTTRGRSAVVPYGLDVPNPGYANPLPQALVLTAIVIGFGLLAFSLVLVYRTYQEHGTLDPDSLRAAEPLREGQRIKPDTPNTRRAGEVTS